MIDVNKPVMQISFSGGRTSGYMTKKLLDEYSDKYNFIVTFANTGMEHEKTLEFVNSCDKVFNFNTVWLESKVYQNERKGTGFKITNYETASRKGEPFEQVIQKYGIPNPSWLHCTRELKLAPMQTYLASLGLDYRKIPTAIGIRTDETRRVRKDAESVNIIYPLIDMFPTDKQDVLDWWEEQPFDLGIEEWDGNCKGCFKKSFKKIFKQIESDPTLLQWHQEMEEKYGDNGAKKIEGTRRVFFRGNTSAKQLQAMYFENKDTDSIVNTESGTCSESCEMYETVIESK